MLTARPTRIGRWFWKTFSTLGIRFRFHDFHIMGDIIPRSNQSILLLGNHISWWDGFWPLYVNHQLFHKEYYVMMLEKELSQRQFMRQGGAFSIQPGSRSMLESLQYTRKLLENPENLVLMYPQGKIHSIYDTEIEFAPGIERILKKTQGSVQVVFFAAFVEFLSQSKPTVFFRMQAYELPDSLAKGELAEAYQRYYEEALQMQVAYVREFYG